MKIESIKLSPKRGGNNYVSSYSISIAQQEVETCQLANKRIIKCVDDKKQEKSIRAKCYTLTDEIIRTVCRMTRAANLKSQGIHKNHCVDSRQVTMFEGYLLKNGQKIGKEYKCADELLEKYLADLPMESIVDLTLLMYLGRDFDADMDTNPGEERFLEFYDRYNYIVLGQEKHILIDIITEKAPLAIYLESGVRILNVPKGTSIDDLPQLDWSEFRSEQD